MALPAWVPKYIRQIFAKPKRYVVTSEEYNEILNLLIEQGDWNTDQLVVVRENLILKLDTAIAASTYATKDELTGLVLGQIPAGSITPTELSFDPVTETELTAALSNFSTGAGIAILNSDMTGTKKADGLSQNNSCCYATTSPTVPVDLAYFITDKVNLGLQSIILRMRTSVNVLSSDVIKVEVFRNNGGSFVSMTSKTFKTTVFTETSDYQCLYVPLNYKGGAATDNELKVVVTLLANGTACEVALDTVTILPSTLGIVG